MDEWSNVTDLLLARAYADNVYAQYLEEKQDIWDGEASRNAKFLEERMQSLAKGNK